MDSIKVMVSGVQYSPETNFDSVKSDNGTSLKDTITDLYRKVGTGSNSSNNATDSRIVETDEAGFYISDSNGNYVASIDSNGKFDAVDYGDTLDDILDEFKESLPTNTNSNTTDINIDSTEKIGTIKRITDGGLVESDLYRTFIYKRDISAGDVEITVDADLFIYRDYIRVNCNVPFTWKDYTFTQGNQVKLTLTFNKACNNVWVEVCYSLATDEQVAQVDLEIESDTTDGITLTQSTSPFNSTASIMWTIDDGQLGDYSYWCATHGYYAKEGTRGDVHAEDILNNTDSQTVLFDRFTFDDGTGKQRLVEATHALMNVADTCSNGMYKNVSLQVEDLKLMESLGDSFAWHDITANDTYTNELGDNVDLDRHNTYLANNDLTGIKVAITPSGIQSYAVIMQHKPTVVMCTVEGAANWTDPQTGIEHVKEGLSRNVADWTTGLDLTSFRTTDVVNKPTKVYSRLFINSDSYETANDYETYFNLSLNYHELRPFGYHGTGFNYVLPKMKSLLDSHQNVSYLSLDHLWEYYHIYNNMVIDNVRNENGKVKAKVWIPHCQFERYGEITLNCNITDGGNITVSNNVIGLSAKQNADKYTINLSVCPKLKKDRDYWKALHEKYPNNERITRDYNYINGLLRAGLRT